MFSFLTGSREDHDSIWHEFPQSASVSPVVPERARIQPLPTRWWLKDPRESVIFTVGAGPASAHVSCFLTFSRFCRARTWSLSTVCLVAT